MPHPYKCYSEIMLQPEALEACIRVVTSQENNINAFYKVAQPDEILFIGCTSPYYIGKSTAHYWQTALGIPIRAVTASEFVQFPEQFHSPRSRSPLLIAISRSGMTSETIWAVEKFEKKFPGRTILISCAPGAPLTKLAALKILLPEGMEDTLAQTKSFSAMYLAAQMMCALISGDDFILAKLREAPSIITTILKQTEPVVQKIFQHKDFRNIFFIGSGPQYGIALDAALKMMEMSLSEVMCFPFLESRHGPKSIIDDKSLVVGLFSRAGQGYEAQVMEEYTMKHAAITVAVTPDSDWETGNPVFHIPVDFDWPECVLGLLYLPVIQLMAYYRAISKDVNPDESNNLTQYIEIPRVITDIE